MELFKLLGTIAVDTTQANRALDSLSQKTGKTHTEIETAVNKIGTVAMGLGRALVGAGAVMGTAWFAAIEGTREYRAEMGLLDSAFQASGHSSTEAKNTYSALNAVLGDTEQAVEAAQHIAMIADNEKEMNTLTDIGTGVFARFGQSLPLEGLMEGVLHTSQLGEVQGSLADALEWSGITVEDFNDQLAKCSNEEERQDLIMKTLKDTYGKAATQYKETNKDVMEARKAQERLTDAMAELGRIGEPILTAIKNAVADMVAAAVPKLESLIQKVKDARKWMQENKSTVDKWKAAIVGTTVAVGSFLAVLAWGKVMKAAKTAILGLRGAVLLLNVAMKANIIGLIVSLVLGLVAAFVTLWKNNEGFRKFWINLWAKIKSACGSAVNWIKGKFSDFKGALKTVQNVFGNIQRTITDKLNSARDKVKNAIDRIKGFFNFKWSLPKLKMPSFSMKGKFSLNPPSVPKLSVKWNAEGGILTKPTIFGQMGDTMLGGGEAGPEAIAPIDTLQKYIREAVSFDDAGIRQTLIEQFQLLMDFLSMNMPHDVLLNGNTLVGELVPTIDGRLADRWSHSKRGNVR